MSSTDAYTSNVGSLSGFASPHISGEYSTQKNYTDNAITASDTNKQKHNSDIDKLYADSTAIPAKQLYKEQHRNIAKNNPQGNLNNKSFNNTLYLSRKADAYNNKPQEQLRLGGSFASGTGTYNLGQAEDKYKRPTIETEEMRQMSRNRQLDYARQALRVQLQGKVDQWQYDAANRYVDQLAAMNLSDYQFRQELNKFLHEQQQLAELTRETSKQQYLNQLGQMSRILDKAKEYIAENPMYAQLITPFLGHTLGQGYSVYDVADINQQRQNAGNINEQTKRAYDTYNNLNK